MSLEIAIEGFIATVERLDVVPLFQTTDEDCHSASHRSDEGFRRIGSFSRCEICKTLQLSRCPRDLHTGKRELRGNTFEAWKHEFPSLARFTLAENAMAALSLPHSPAEQDDRVGKKIRVAAKLQLLLQTANHAVLGRSQISLKL
jgi:hypothetical protein